MCVCVCVCVLYLTKRKPVEYCDLLSWGYTVVSTVIALPTVLLKISRVGFQSLFFTSCFPCAFVTHTQATETPQLDDIRSRISALESNTMLQAGTNYTSVLSGFDLFSNCTTVTEAGSICVGSSPCESFFNTPIQVVCVPTKSNNYFY